MKSYSQNLKFEIKHYQESIERNKENLRMLKEELFTGENIYYIQTHKRRIRNLSNLDFILRQQLKKLKRLIH